MNLRHGFGGGLYGPAKRGCTETFSFDGQNCTPTQFCCPIHAEVRRGTGDAPDGSPSDMQELQFSMRRVDDVEVIEMTGAVDALAFTGLSATMTRMMEEVTPCIILECSRVSYIGSAQLKELLDLAHMAQARGGDVRCVGLPQTIQQVANLIAMGDLIEFYNDLHEALRSFRGLNADVAEESAGATPAAGRAR